MEKKLRETREPGLLGLFRLTENQSTVRTEVLAGITTFVTMAYVLGTVPNIMANAGMERGNVLSSMILLTILTTVAMSIVTNRPFALAPGLGSVAVVSGMIAQEGVPVSVACGVIFWSGILFVLISFLGIRDAVISAIPRSLKQSVSAGVGLFIALLGCRNASLIVAREGKNCLGFGNLMSPSVLLCFIGFLLIIVMKMLKIPGYMIFSILLTTLIGIPLGITKVPETWISLPQNPFADFGQLDIRGALHPQYFPFLIALFVPDFFSTFGTALGVGGKAGYLDEKGNLPGIDRVFKVDATATVAGSLFGIPCMTTYLESSAGIEAGGRTGLTTLTTSFCFALAFFFTPIALMIPSAATAPALIVIGVGMLSSMEKINYQDFTECFPAFLCIAFTIFANNIANGICVAIPSFVVMKLASKKAREIPPAMYIMTVVCFLYFYSIMK